MDNKYKNKVKIICAVCSALAGVSALTLSILTAEYFSHKVAIIAPGIMVFLIGLCAAIGLDYTSGVYECKCCSHRFKPSLCAYIFGIHTLTTRLLKCPECGKNSFCRRKLD